MTFGEALERCKKGARICRTGWNGKDQYVELATNISYINSQGDLINTDHKSIGSKTLAFVGTSGVQLGWLASQADMLATDWVILTVKQKTPSNIVNDLLAAAQYCRTFDGCRNCPYADKRYCQRAILNDVKSLLDGYPGK